MSGAALLFGLRLIPPPSGNSVDAVRRFEHDRRVIRASDVVDLHRRLIERGCDWCIVGGWGVDALVGEQTRPHKDLDVLLPLAAMNEALSLVAGQGFHLAYAWEESQPVGCGHPLVGMPAPSAFVLDHRDGRQVDVHVYDVGEGKVSALWDTDRTWRPADLAVVGTINAVQVRCISAAMQLVAIRDTNSPRRRPRTYAFCSGWPVRPQGRDRRCVPALPDGRSRQVPCR